MTKYVSPEIAGTELKPADYKRYDDGATMCWDGLGSFNAKPGSFAPKIIKPLRVKPFSKRRVIKPRCNATISSTARNNIRGGITSAFRERADVGFDQCTHFRFRNFVIPSAVNRFRCTIAWTPRSQFRERLPLWLPSFFALSEVSDTTNEAALNRAKIAVYDAEFPKSKLPEHKIFGRASRNGSPQYGDETLKSLGEYIDVHGSTEPLQSVFMIGQRSQEIEMRPSPEELAELWNDPSITYEVRTISAAPPLSQCGYVTPFYSEMKIPVSGDVKYWVTASKSKLSEDKLQRRLGNKGASQEKIDSEIKELARLEIVGFKNRGKSWALCSFGGMEFAPCRYTKNGRIVYRGELTDNGQYAAQDKLVQPQELECPGSDNKFWAPLVPRELSNKALPYNVDSEDELQFGYCYDPRSEPPKKNNESSDGINPYVLLERKQMRDAYEGLLAPETLRVSEGLLGLAKNRKEIGRALSDDQTLDEQTYERRGGAALNDTLKDITKVRQILAD